MKSLLTPALPNLMRFGSIFTATIILAMIVSSFKIKDVQAVLIKPDAPGTHLFNKVSTIINVLIICG